MRTKLLSMVHFFVKLENEKRRECIVYPTIRVITALLIILLCALSKNMIFVFAIIAVELFRLALFSAQRIVSALLKMIFPIVFTMLIMLPAYFFGNGKTAVTIATKVLESFLVIIVLMEDISWKDVSDIFRTRLTGFLSVIIDMCVRFFVILGRVMTSLTESVWLRSVNTKKKKESFRYKNKMITGGVLGTTFLVSEDMAKKTSEAMLCRMYFGEYPKKKRRKLNAFSIMYSLLIPLLIFLFLYSEKLMNNMS